MYLFIYKYKYMYILQTAEKNGKVKMKTSQNHREKALKNRHQANHFQVYVLLKLSSSPFTRHTARPYSPITHSLPFAHSRQQQGRGAVHARIYVQQGTKCAGGASSKMTDHEREIEMIFHQADIRFGPIAHKISEAIFFDYRYPTSPFSTACSNTHPRSLLFKCPVCY